MLSLKQQQQLQAMTGCEMDTSNLALQLYATDASLYQIAPSAVAFPRTVEQAAAAIRAAAALNLAVTPRGAGTGLTGGALGDGLIVDFARFNRGIHSLDLERRTVRVGAGVVLDQLNQYLQPYGFQFGPDVATSSRATLGGMIANNSSGARAPWFGCTGDHVLGLEVVLANGRVARADAAVDSPLAGERQSIQQWVARNQSEITNRMPPGLVKRWPGYGLDRCLREPERALTHILAGSEGTLAGIFSAELRIVPLPREKGLALIYFASVAEAMQATVALLDLKPAAIEHVDRILFDQTRGQRNFQAARDLLELDAKPCEAFLIVEFYEDVAARLAEVEKRRLGRRTRLLRGASEMALVWGLRKAGLSLLTGCKGSAKPTTCIEDVAVRPEQLPEYVAAVAGILKPLKVSACFYGHAASGLLHIRPVLDLHRAEGVRQLRQITDEVSALTRQFRGSLAAEHGVGIARTEYLPAHTGPKLMAVFQEIKSTFDPGNRLNPGKIIPDGRYQVDAMLRQSADQPLSLPFEPMLAFAARDDSFLANLEQCNGCGGCLKQAPTMCPTFIATGQEVMSTRGRANTIRAVLEGRLGIEHAQPMTAPELAEVLNNCLSCKACTVECPSNVNLSLLKAELVHARWQNQSLPLRVRAISAADALGRLGCAFPRVANALLQTGVARGLMRRVLGFAPDRPLPRYATERFDHWFEQRLHPGPRGARGKVILWDDTFVRYHEPHIGRAAVHVLEAAGFEVTLLAGRACCGRPAFSQGNLDEAARLGRHNLELLTVQPEPLPVIFLEPSCWAMFVEDYRELKLPGAATIAARCFLFEQFIEELLGREPNALALAAGRTAQSTVAIHTHCHAKALMNPQIMARLAARVPGVEARLLNTGCCGMAGAFGYQEEKQALSQAVAQPLLEQIAALPANAVVLASGTSCRQQIEHLGHRRAGHIAEWLAAALP